MILTIPRDELARALYCLQGVVERKPLVPINGHALLEAKGGQLRVAATDGDVSLSATRPVEIGQSASVAVAARQFYDIIKSLPNDEVILGKKDGGLLVTCASSSFRLATLPADQFPALPSAKGSDTWTMPASELNRMLERALSCVSQDDSRHNLAGVFFEPQENEGLRLVSTDGHRLALVEGQVSGHKLPKEGVLLPRKGLTELRRVLSDAPKDAAVSVGTLRQGAVFTCAGVTLTTRAIEAVFPDYRQVLPAPGDRRAVFPRDVLQDAVRRVSIVSRGGSWGVRVKLSDGRAILEAEDPTLGEASETLDLAYHGEACTVGFNARYLLDALSLMDKGDVELRLVDEMSPGLLAPADGGGFTALVMPMRV